MKCQRPNCPNVLATRGLCKKHYRALDTKPVKAETVARRITLLRSWGYTLQDIADLADLKYYAVGRIAGGKTRYALKPTADAIMAIPIPTEIRGAENPRRSPRIPSIGTRRRIQGLVAMGHSQTAIGKELGVSHQAVANWASHEWVTAATAARVRDVFNRLQLMPGTHKHACVVARQRGWAPAWAWDEDEIDNPEAVPFAGKKKRVSLTQEYRDLRSLGVTEEALVARFNLDKKTRQYLRKVS